MIGKERDAWFSPLWWLKEFKWDEHFINDKKKENKEGIKQGKEGIKEGKEGIEEEKEGITNPSIHPSKFVTVLDDVDNDSHSKTKAKHHMDSNSKSTLISKTTSSSVVSSSIKKKKDDSSASHHTNTMSPNSNQKNRNQIRIAQSFHDNLNKFANSMAGMCVM